MKSTGGSGVPGETQASANGGPTALQPRFTARNAATGCVPIAATEVMWARQCHGLTPSPSDN